MIGAAQEVHSLLVETGTLPDHTNPCFQKKKTKGCICEKDIMLHEGGRSG